MKKSRYSILFVVLISWLLVACGGGSSSSPPPPPAVATGVTAVAKDGYVLVDATLAADATGANVYYSTSAGVTTSTGTKVIVGSSPQAITGLTNTTPYYFIVTALNAGGESAATTAVSAVPQTTSLTGDPLYGDQWHLISTGSQTGAGPTGTTAVAGQDLNVVPAWTNSIPSVTNKKGEGVRVAVVDDGLEIGHEDLASNMAANDQSYNYVTGSNDPTNSPSDTTSGHGTAVAGIIAARDDNGLGVRGVAPRATLVGYNLLQSSISTNEADAMTRNRTAVSISSNSWGAADGTGELSASTSLWRTAINSGLANGRANNGTVYLWAAGNGGTVNSACPSGCDNSNYDGRANFRGVMAVAAVNDQGKKSSYSELGANLWVSAPGGEFCSTHTITTTDRSGSLGFNKTGASPDYDNTKLNYTRCMNGTSSATPAVAGVVALMLAAKPSLGWRDVREILAITARQNDPGTGNSTGWNTNGAGYLFNHQYGFGVANAAAAVALAASWANVTAETTQISTTATPNTPIPDGTGASATSTINVAAGAVSFIEFIEITFSASDHPYMGDLEVTLTNNQSGMVSRLAETHACLNTEKTAVLSACPTFYNNWVFGSSAHLGESPVGSWTLTVTDRGAGDIGHLQSWGMKFYGR